MPIRGIIFIAVVAIAIAIFKRDDIYSWIENTLGTNEDAEEKENEP